MRNLKKINILVFILFAVLGLVACGKNTTTTKKEITTTTPSFDVGGYLYIHYYRYQADYKNWDIWSWMASPISKDGAGYSFTEDKTSDSYGGMIAKIPVEKGSTSVGFIVRKGGSSWEDKDISNDRFVTIPSNFDSDHPVNIYVLEGAKEFSYTLNEAPSKIITFTSSWFTAENKIQVSSNGPMKSSTFHLYKEEVEVTISSISMSGDLLSGVITTSENVDYHQTYTLKGTFDDEQTIDVSFQGLYDTDSFNENFFYDGDDLGATTSSEGTFFRLWAPISSKVTLNLYSTGTTLGDGSASHPGSNTALSTIEMSRGEKGTWTYSTQENLHGNYYTYTVVNGKDSNEVVDPYAKGCGVNGKRGLIVDFSKLNPEGWKYGAWPKTDYTYNDQVLYELHVRDYTISDTWNGKEKAGTYLALAEAGTTFETYKTGFDHLKDLGVTTIQILPIYDWSAGVDESKMEDDKEDHYNWGYMPLNYNCLEGSYSTDPFDGLNRIKEFKSMMMAYAEAGIRVNMDVVYNHTGLTADSNFSLIVPGYYYRLNSDGTYSNGSGCGNETSSERLMMRKFIEDSTKFWVSEYNISGFRFDLMGLIDTTTMDDVQKGLYEINNSIMVYGEPWTGGTTPLRSNIQTVQTNMSNTKGVAAFNDKLRDGVKGSVFDAKGKGFVQGSNSSTPYIKSGISGEFDSDIGSPNQVINYVACHDNNTLHDKIWSSTSNAPDVSRISMVKQALSIVFLSESIPFIYEGDEFLRSKTKADGSFDSNSYDSGDKVNAINWADLKTNESVNNYVKDLIAFRLNHPSFRLTDTKDVSSSLSFLSTARGIIAYTINNTISKDTFNTILVIHSNISGEVSLPLGEWDIVFASDGKTETNLSSTINIGINQTLVLSKK